MNFPKPIVVIYLNCDNVLNEHIQEYVKAVDNVSTPLKGDYHCLIIPRFEEPTKVELLSPFSINLEQYHILLEKINQYLNLKNE